MKINLGAFVQGAIQMNDHLDRREDSAQVRTLRDMEITSRRRTAEQNQRDQEFDDGGRTPPVVEGVAASRPQGSARDEARFGGVNPTASNDEAITSSQSAASIAKTEGVRQGQVEERPLDQAPPAASPAAPVAQAAAPAPAQQSMAPMIQAMGVNPSETPAMPGKPTPAKAAEEKRPSGQVVEFHRNRITRALQLGDPRQVERAVSGYNQALVQDASAFEAEWVQQNRGALYALKTNQLTEAGKEQLHKAQMDMMRRRQEIVAGAAASALLMPEHPDLPAVLQSAFNAPTAAGIRQIDDVTRGKDGKEVRTPMMVVVDANGKPVTMGKAPIQLPMDRAIKLAQSSPLGVALGKAAQKFSAASANGQGVIYNEGTGEVANTFGGPSEADLRAGRTEDRANQTQIDARVKTGVGLLQDQMYAKGAMGGIDSLRDSYKPYFDWAAAEMGRLVRDGANPEQVSKELMNRINRHIEAGGKPADLIGGGAAAAPAPAPKPGTAAPGDSVDAVLRRYGIGN